ncbi:hypothetical protein VZT92_026728 [Zoarces viviparus]|uniref:ribonuclease H n=1 Tax=Zoarces viviparus TaxID=48416 RepID=A0AAW1DQX1_ZOAVI
MALFGRIDEFKPENEQWSAYIERMEQFFEANDVAEDKQVATLLSVMGAATYGLLRNLVQPRKPKDKTFDKIVAVLKEHYEPKPLLVAERFRFNRCNQKANQPVTQYVAELKQCASNCEFGANLDASLRDRPLPFAMKDRVEQELRKLEEANIISPVKHSEWAAPIVPVVKKDKSLRLCGDYKVSANQAVETETYPLPHLEELLATLSGGKIFSKIDLATAYQQVLLNDNSEKYTTINTHRGLFVYNRLPFGISSAPSIFQRIMENLMKGLPVVVFLDDLLIMGRTEKEHLHNLQKVLQRLQENGLRVKRSKCEFGKTRVEYLGHVLDEQGIHPSKDKVRAIQEAPAPTNVKELQAFLGLFNYYGRFVPQQSTVLAPLYRLLRGQVIWKWTEVEQVAFVKCKELLTSDWVLAHYDPSLPLTLACDASAYGIGAVIQHTMPDGVERPIAFASRTLSPAEKKYSQIEKEALGLIYGVKKFHQYLWGRHFNLVTDHKPLLILFGEHKSLHWPQHAFRGGRLYCQRMTTTLSIANQKSTVMLMDSPAVPCWRPATQEQP